MAGISGLGTTYNLPNYTGELIGLTPSETPLLSAIGGLTGGRQTTSTEFEWEFFDLRDASQAVKVEGATAPTAEARVRSNVTNVTQIHQEKVSVSYTKLGATGLKAGSNNDLSNPIGNELDWQVAQMLKQIARDVEYSFISGSYAKPGNNSTARQTRGLLSAISTNVEQAGGAAAIATTTTASTDVFNATAHGLANGTQVVLSDLVTTTGVSEDTVYYVVSTSANTFKLAATLGGTALTLTGDGSASVQPLAAVDVDDIENLLQSVYDNGGISEQDTATLVVNSVQKRAISKAYANAYGKFQEMSRTVGGVNVTTLETNFGVLNVMLDRFVPQHKLIVCSLEQLAPVFLEVPSKGHFFAEPLAKTGASDDVQLYGEVGLAYGNEKSHGVLNAAV